MHFSFLIVETLYRYKNNTNRIQSHPKKRVKLINIPQLKTKTSNTIPETWIIYPQIYFSLLWIQFLGFLLALSAIFVFIWVSWMEGAFWSIRHLELSPSNIPFWRWAHAEEDDFQKNRNSRGTSSRMWLFKRSESKTKAVGKERDFNARCFVIT